MAKKDKAAKASAGVVTVNFTQNSKDFKKLVLLFKKKKIKEGDDPASIRSKYPQWFSKYTASQFRSQYHKAKNIAGIHLAEGPPPADGDNEECKELPSMLSGLNVGGGAATHVEESEEAEEDDTSSNGLWVPKMVTSEWENPDGVCCFTAILMLTSGVVQGDNTGVEVEVTEDGNNLTVAEAFIAPQLDLEMFYQAFPKDPMEGDMEFLHRKFGMLPAAREMRFNQQTVSIYKMKTPFRVDPSQKRVVFLAGRDGTRYVHIDLAEKKKLQKQTVVIVDKALVRKSGNPSPAMKQNEFSVLG